MSEQESVLQPERENRSSPASQQERHVSIPIDFERSFQLFPLRFDNTLIRYWYVLVLVDVLLSAILHAIADILYRYSFTEAVKITLGDWTWAFIVWHVALVLGLLFFDRWRRSIPRTLQLLYHNLLFNQEDTRFRDMYESYQKTLLSRKRTLLTALSLLCFLLLYLIVILELRNTYRPLYLSIWLIPLSIFSSLLYGYTTAIASWTLFVTSFYIKDVTSTFDFGLQPSHPDKCGGLKFLGNFCLGMVLPILMVAIIVAILSIGSVLHPFPFSPETASATTLVCVILVLCILPLATYAFFAPLWNVHRQMVEKKEAYVDKFSSRFVKLEQQMWMSLDTGALEEAKVTKEEMELLQILHPDTIQYPGWPFDQSILLKFLTPQIVPLISLIVGLSPPAAEALKGILSIISGK